MVRLREQTHTGYLVVNDLAGGNDLYINTSVHADESTVEEFENLRSAREKMQKMFLKTVTNPIRLQLEVIVTAIVMTATFSVTKLLSMYPHV